MPTKDELTGSRLHTLISEADRAVEGLLGDAAAARQAFLASQAAEREKLSVRGWQRGLLALAGHDQDVVTALAARMARQPHLFEQAGAYVHQVARMIADGWWWAPGQGTPTTPGSDKDAVQREVQAVANANIYTLLLLAVDAAARMNAKAFGPHDDMAALTRDGTAVRERAERAMARWREVPMRHVFGLAVERGVSLDPPGNLYERLVDHTLAPPPTPRRVAPRTERAVFVG
jgi:hypothetical protein